ASGTAIDWIAPSHPNGQGGTFTNSQVGTIYAILDEVQGGVDWLEGYDEMHFEIAVSANTLAGIAASLPGGGAPIPPEPPKDWFDMATEEDLRRIVREEIDAANIAGDVWGFEQTSKVTGQPTVMAEVVLYTNQHTEPDA